MALITKARGTQYPLFAEFIANFGDTMKDVNGVIKTFGSVFADQGTFEVVNIPEGATLEGGELIVETAGVGPTAYTLSVGTVAGGVAVLLGATSVLATGRTPLGFGTGMQIYGGTNVTVTVASTVANATAGRFRVRLFYTIDGRVQELSPN